MNVGSEKKAVIDTVLSLLSDRLDVSGFERWESFLAGNRTVTLVRIGY